MQPTARPVIRRAEAFDLSTQFLFFQGQPREFGRSGGEVDGEPLDRRRDRRVALGGDDAAAPIGLIVL